MSVGLQETKDTTDKGMRKNEKKNKYVNGYAYVNLKRRKTCKLEAR